MNKLKYKGFSLVSILIATAIGVFIMGAAGTVYVDSKQAFQTRSAISSVTENGRFALEDIRRTLVLTGRGVSGMDDSPAVYTLDDNGLRSFPAVGAGGIEDTDSNGNSIIAVRLRGTVAAPLLSCGGMVTGTSTIRFLVNGNDELVCELDGNAQPLLSGIYRMRALYGVDDDADGYADRYLSADQVDTEIKWVNVVSIRIGLVAGSGDEAKLPKSMQAASVEDLNLLGETFTPADTEHLFRVATTTISLRNLNGIVEKQ